MAAIVRNKNDVDSVLAPARHAVAVTPNDGTDLPYATTAIWVGGAGNVALDTVGGEANVLISGIGAGTLLPIQATRVRATGTTATLIVALG